jgi:hypothetical protein
MAFGTGLLLALLLGFLILGPKQMRAVLGRAAQAKAQFDRATCNLKAQLARIRDLTPAELDADLTDEP